MLRLCWCMYERGVKSQRAWPLPVSPLLLPMEAVVLPLAIDATVVLRAAGDAEEHVPPATWVAKEHRLQSEVVVLVEPVCVGFMALDTAHGTVGNVQETLGAVAVSVAPCLAVVRPHVVLTQVYPAGATCIPQAVP